MGNTVAMLCQQGSMYQCQIFRGEGGFIEMRTYTCSSHSHLGAITQRSNRMCVQHVCTAMAAVSGCPSSSVVPMSRHQVQHPLQLHGGVVTPAVKSSSCLLGSSWAGTHAQIFDMLLCSLEQLIVISTSILSHLCKSLGFLHFSFSPEQGLL